MGSPCPNYSQLYGGFTVRPLFILFLLPTAMPMKTTQHTQMKTRWETGTEGQRPILDSEVGGVDLKHQAGFAPGVLMLSNWHHSPRQKREYLPSSLAPVSALRDPGDTSSGNEKLSFIPWMLTPETIPHPLLSFRQQVPENKREGRAGAGSEHGGLQSRVFSFLSHLHPTDQEVPWALLSVHIPSWATFHQSGTVDPANRIPWRELHEPSKYSLCFYPHIPCHLFSTSDTEVVLLNS